MKTPGPLYLVAAATLAAAAYVLWANQSASVVYTGDPADGTDGTDSGAGDTSSSFDFNDIGSSVSNIFTSVSAAVSDPNVQAFLAMIRRGEGTTGANGYRTLFGGGLFNDYSRHPNIAVTRGALTSTAAGAYQILYRTWIEVAASYGLTDFSPASQDVAAVALIKRRGALADVLAGRWTAAIGKCAKEWASLPGSPYGQPTISMDTALAVIAANGGGVAA
ncbi:glycoside hydrolase family 104 protein [Caballeronia sp. LZ016]|uniref:glycoside hydrolase family 24 protein n=1 Tax=Caballeronia sp. LZ016 TaxID=3038554 RepID=UPI00285D4B16|nr:glycoside hydrolase family 104 protein [Caballeronia sp. LZ016]MDR5739491.1 glycoside hydrolase family 104 protein [Caballeronia sp. LZ016]